MSTANNDTGIGDRKRPLPSSKARDYFSQITVSFSATANSDGGTTVDKNRLMCDLCQKPVKAPSGKTIVNL